MNAHRMRLGLCPCGRPFRSGTTTDAQAIYAGSRPTPSRLLCVRIFHEHDVTCFWRKDADGVWRVAVTSPFYPPRRVFFRETDL